MNNEIQRIDIQKLLDPIKPLMDMPTNRINQRVGYYISEDQPCCVGAHMAKLLDVAESETTDFLDGIDAWIELVGGNRAHAILMLRYAGAGKQPLSDTTWPVEPKKVFENLRAIEILPSLSGATFMNEVLFNVDFSGLDLSSSVFKECAVGNANFTGCIMRRCDFRDADAMYANFSGADLTTADFTRADLQNAKFHNANLTDVNFRDAELDGADFDGAILEGVSTKRKIFERALGV